MNSKDTVKQAAEEREQRTVIYFKISIFQLSQIQIRVG